ncbi:MAG: threonine/serine dehydratase [Candidatus Eiseniibacteriota bacterium]
MIPLAEIRAAAERIAGRVHRTPLLGSRTLGDRAGVELRLKCECLQKTGAFKARGALNKILSLGEAERRRGIITVSAGNHAGAVAWAAKQVGAQCTVVMPVDAPRSKTEAVRGYGAEIVPHADRTTLFDKLRQEEARRGSVFVHPFDDPVVLAGAGTAGLEIVQDWPEVDAVVVPVGGGGLIGGVASAVKQLRPDAKVFAVELEDGPGLAPAPAGGKPVPAPRPATLADGLSAPFVGALPLAIAREAVDDIAFLTEAEMIEAMRLLLSRAKLLVEASGAAAVAALLAGKIAVPAGARVVAILSGGNVDLDRLCGALFAGRSAGDRAREPAP